MTTLSTVPTFPAVGVANFNTLAYTWAQHIAGTFRTELNTIVGEVDTNATSAAASAGTATTQAGIATTQVGLAAAQVTLATTQASNAATSASNALLSETNAAASATTAVNAPGTSATSTTSLTIALGAQSLTVQTGKALVVGMSVKIANTASPTNWMYGDITAYNSVTGALSVNVTAINGSGTIAAWTVSLTGPNGVGALPKYTIQDKTTAYAVTSGDHATVIRTTSGVGSITLPTTTAAGVGFYFTYVNETAGSINIVTSGTDTWPWGSLGNLIVSPGSAVTIACATASAAGKWKVTSQAATASGVQSIAIGGATASGGNAIAIGNTGTSSGTGSIVIGNGVANNSSAVSIQGGTASGNSSFAFGGTASGVWSVAFTGNSATAQNSIAVGLNGLADFIGKYVQGVQSPRGGLASSQYARTVLSASATAINTNYVLISDSSAIASASNIINVPLSRLVTFIATVSAGQVATSGSSSAGWKVEGVIRRGNTGNVALVGTPTVTSLGGTVPTGWTLTATADITNQGLALTFNMGATAMGNVYVSATVHASEVAI